MDEPVHEEDFQDVNDNNEHFPWCPLSRVNAYNQVEHYQELPLFYSNEWKREGEHCTWNAHDGMNMVQGAVLNGSRNTNTDNKDIHDYHNWQGSTSTKSSLHTWSSWPYYDDLLTFLKTYFLLEGPHNFDILWTYMIESQKNNKMYKIKNSKVHPLHKPMLLT